MAATGHTYVVEKKCPICEQMTHVTKVRSRLLAETTDEDFCVHYKDFNPYLYNIWVCEHCGFAAAEKEFIKPMAARPKKKIKDFLDQRSVGFAFHEERGLPEAVASYKLAIYFSEMIDMSYAHCAGLYLRLGWVYRLAGDTEKEVPMLEKAAELYDQSVMTERYPIGSMTDNMAIFLVGAIYYRTGNLEKATQYLSRIMSDNNVRTMDPKVYERARDLWQDIRSRSDDESAAEPTETAE